MNALHGPHGRRFDIISMALIGGNYPRIQDGRGRTVCEVPWQGDRDATIALGYRLTDEYAKQGFMNLGPAPIKIHMRFTEYKVVDGLGDGQVILEDSEGQRSVWFANKNHANPGIIYRNTHLEFARSL